MNGSKGRHRGSGWIRNNEGLSEGWGPKPGSGRKVNTGYAIQREVHGRVM